MFRDKDSLSLLLCCSLPCLSMLSSTAVSSAACLGHAEQRRAALALLAFTGLSPQWTFPEVDVWALLWSLADLYTWSPLLTEWQSNWAAGPVGEVIYLWLFSHIFWNRFHGCRFCLLLNNVVLHLSHLRSYWLKTAVQRCNSMQHRQVFF